MEWISDSEPTIRPSLLALRPMVSRHACIADLGAFGVAMQHIPRRYGPLGERTCMLRRPGVRSGHAVVLAFFSWRTHMTVHAQQERLRCTCAPTCCAAGLSGDTEIRRCLWNPREACDEEHECRSRAISSPNPPDRLAQCTPHHVVPGGGDRVRTGGGVRGGSRRGGLIGLTY